jgi:hypothetical protein
MTITSEMYQTIPQFIQYYFDFIKMITSRGWVPKNFDKAKVALSDLFRPDSWFGEIDENVVINFASIYQFDLEKLKQYISDKNK